MSYKKEDLRIIEGGVDFVRRRPEMFFEGGHPSVHQLAAHVMRDVVGVGNIQSAVEISGSTVFIAANVDWMDSARAGFQEIWTRFAPPTPLERNSLRSEVLLAAVCQGVRSEGRVGSISIGCSLPEPSDAIKDAAGAAGRWLAFRLNP